MKLKQYGLIVLSALILVIVCACAGVNAPHETETHPLLPPDGTQGVLDPLPPESGDETGKNPPSTNDPPASDPPVSNPPVNTEPPLIDPPIPPVTDGDARTIEMKDGIAEWTVESSSGTMLNLVALCEASMNRDGTMLVSVHLFLSHYQIYLNPRSGCILGVDGQKQVFDTEQIVYEEPARTMTYLASIEVKVDPSQSFDIQAMLPFNGVYGGVELDLLTISERFIIKR